ncbi:MAG: HEAT repeat domain-containing protein [Actinobacteria bacterium]|nr:HEAT repeat domain-containing protein [Actinomycetota bacterium]
MLEIWLICPCGQALGKIKDARAVEPLIKVLKDKDENSDVRRWAAEALRKIGYRF